MLMLVITLALVGFLVYMVTEFIPMPQIFKTGILVIVALCVLLYLIRVFGIADLPVPQLR